MVNTKTSLGKILIDFFKSFGKQSKNSSREEKLEVAVNAQVEPDNRDALIKELRDSLKRADKIAEKLETTGSKKLSSSIKVEEVELEEKTGITVEEVELDETKGEISR